LIKEVLPKKHGEKHLGATRSPENLEDVGPSDTLKKQQHKNLPLAYYSAYVI